MEENKKHQKQIQLAFVFGAIFMAFLILIAMILIKLITNLTN